jgi:hypothetical protein
MLVRSDQRRRRPSGYVASDPCQDHGINVRRYPRPLPIGEPGSERNRPNKNRRARNRFLQSLEVVRHPLGPIDHGALPSRFRDLLTPDGRGFVDNVLRNSLFHWSKGLVAGSTKPVRRKSCSAARPARGAGWAKLRQAIKNLNVLRFLLRRSCDFGLSGRWNGHQGRAHLHRQTRLEQRAVP